ILKGALPATKPAAPSPAVNVRRVTRAVFDCDLRFILKSSLAQHSAVGPDDAGFVLVLTSAKIHAGRRRELFRVAGIGSRCPTNGLPTMVYPAHVTTRKSFGLMTRKLSVTESHRLAQFRGTFSRRKPSVASAN